MKFTFDNITYDFLKKAALIYLPSYITFFLAMVKIWGIPYGVEIGATLAAFNTFLGACLGVSSSNYYKGDDADDRND